MKVLSPLYKKWHGMQSNPEVVLSLWLPIKKPILNKIKRNRANKKMMLKKRAVKKDENHTYGKRKILACENLPLWPTVRFIFLKY